MYPSVVFLATIGWIIELYPLILLTCLAGGSRPKNVTSAVTRLIRSVGFPQGSGMGIFFAIGIPVDIPDKSVSLAFYFEANYLLPNEKNSTYFEEYLSGRGFLERRIAYSIIQSKLENAGYPGRACLLRAICEAAALPVRGDGLIGDILHIIFTPSSSKNEDLPAEIIEAEKNKNCQQYCDCPISILDLISYYN